MARTQFQGEWFLHKAHVFSPQSPYYMLHICLFGISFGLVWQLWSPLCSAEQQRRASMNCNPVLNRLWRFFVIQTFVCLFFCLFDYLFDCLQRRASMNCNPVLNRHCRFFSFKAAVRKKGNSWKGVKSVETTLTYLHCSIQVDICVEFILIRTAFCRTKREMVILFSQKCIGATYIEAECCNCWICQNCTDVQLVRSNLTGILTYLVVTHDGIGAAWFQNQNSTSHPLVIWPILSSQ